MLSKVCASFTLTLAVLIAGDPTWLGAHSALALIFFNLDRLETVLRREHSHHA